ncbi:hypothetical protein MKX83_07180 [Cytobacillus sp. FSL M8-0252]|uniref:hypothetical protein n=1 Tax=Cytobacillus sp. FSL M8-0252 TaxID=2921621 RepID=UPI0030FBF000
MKKNKRALLAIMLVLSMLLAACGSGGGQASGDGEGESIKLGFTLALRLSDRVPAVDRKVNWKPIFLFLQAFFY